MEAESSFQNVVVYNFIIQTMDKVQNNSFTYYNAPSSETFILRLFIHCTYSGLKTETVLLKRTLLQKRKFSGTKENSFLPRLLSLAKHGKP
jgi:hypothetical protein